MALEDDDVPVLNDVVRTGNVSIIQSTRLEHVSSDHLDSDAAAPLRFELPAHLQIDNLAYDLDPQDSISEGLLALKNSISSNDSLSPDESNDEQLELMIDEIIDKHIDSLRTDLRILLRRAQDLP